MTGMKYMHKDLVKSGITCTLNESPLSITGVANGKSFTISYHPEMINNSHAKPHPQVILEIDHSIFHPKDNRDLKAVLRTIV